MTVSSLATKERISPNTSGWRGAPSKITIHHTAGVISADGLGQVFASPARQASCNYGIGNDGEIICILPEEYHPWTSRSYWNDEQAVTFEVSNSYAGDPWPIGDAAWKSMIALAADICSRYGIEPYYDGTPNATFTEHRMFAATGCPGEYIHSRMYQIVEEVKKAMNGASGSWKHDSKGWWFEYSDGSWPASAWEYINGKWYWFGADGYMATGWIYYNGEWYYLQPQTKDTGDSYGYMVTGWAKIKYGGKESWFWFDGDGAMAYDAFLKIGGAWYAFDGNGVMVEDSKELVVSKNGDITIK